MALPLPPPGPDYYAARRARWITASPPQPHIHPSHARLQHLLSSPDAHIDTVWHRGVDKVWDAFARGNRLKHPLPMSLVVKVIHAAWRRDSEIWPEGAVVPDSDDPP